jgi:hypothetical protein
MSIALNSLIDDVTKDPYLIASATLIIIFIFNLFFLDLGEKEYHFKTKAIWAFLITIFFFPIVSVLMLSILLFLFSFIS